MPATLPKEEHEAEYQRLSTGLRVLISEIGRPREWELVVQDQTSPPEIVNVSLGPSHVLVSQEHESYFYAFYRVQFEEEGEGYFRLDFEPKIGVAQMTFSLPREKSVRMSEIAETLLRETARDF